MTFLKVALALAGSLLLLFGLFKALWEVYSWGKLSELGQRAPLVGTNPRIRYKVELVAAAIGATMVLSAAFLL